MVDINWVTRHEEVVSFLNDEEDSVLCGLSIIEELGQDSHNRSHGSDTIIDIDRFNDQNHNESDNSNLEKAEEHSATVPSTLIFDLTKTPTNSSVKRKRSIVDESGAVLQKVKEKQMITFDSVTVYYFPREQGFTCVPSDGGSTLGMSTHHSQVMKFSIDGHATEQRRIHRRLMLKQLKIDENDNDSEEGFDDAPEFEFFSRYSLPTLHPKNRRALLRSAGVRKIDALEEDECRSLRDSRGNCGCDCEDCCDPDTCFCSQNGIKCQVDVLNFPCACTPDNCGNTSGRTEYNMDRVRTHLNDTLIRLNLEKIQEDMNEKSMDPACMNNKCIN